MKTRQSKRLHNENVGTTKPEHLHNKEESTMSKYLYYAGYVILAALTLFFCWMFCLRWGVFGAKVDWISQHSVIPDYFRKQFYETGNLFPEFAMNLGGGQNIYNYSYYGLYSPLFLLSYALPFVKMSTYVIVMEILCAADPHGLLAVRHLQRHRHADGGRRLHHRRGAGLGGNCLQYAWLSAEKSPNFHLHTGM